MESLEAAAEYYAHNYFNMHETNNYQALNQGFISGVNWQINEYSNFIDTLESESFEGWSQDAIDGYLTACQTIKLKFKK